MSELGSLSQCMMENDAAALGRARRLRREALVASICLESGVLAALLLWPLAAPGVLPSALISTPTVPIHVAQRTDPPRPQEPHPAPHRPVRPSEPWLQPPIIPTHTDLSPDPEPPNIVNEPNEMTFLPGIPGGGDSGPAVQPEPPSEAARKNSPIKVSEGIMEARLIHRVEPVYPRMALDAHLPGTVRLHALIGTDGTVRHIEVVSGSPIFVPSAVAAIQQWRYQPTRLNGQPVDVETYITVEFLMR